MASDNRSGDPSDLRLPPRGPVPRRGRSGLWIALVAGAVVLGVGLGLMARPELGLGQPARPMQPAAPAGDPQMQVLVNPPTIAKPPPLSGGRLEVLPDDMVQAAPQAPQPPVAPEAPIALEPPVAPEAPVPPRPRDAIRASFDCAQARPGAEEMVCGDPRLAAADRRLALAYRSALEAGVPAPLLRRQQSRWYEAREAAARDSPAAVAQVYEARIAELQDETAEAQGPGR